MADVIGSAEIEIRASTRQLKSDMARAERESASELKKVEAAARHAQRELKQAFGDAGHSEFERSMRIIRNASEHTEDEVRAAAQRVANDLKGRYREMGADIGATLMGVSRTAQIAFAAITAYSLKLASDAGEIESAFGVAFGSAEADARSFSDALSEAVGRDAVVLREQMTKLQLVLTGTGVAAETASEMVKALTTSGVDAGSLFNTSDAEALQKIISGLTGETEPLKAFGVVINEAAVEAELLRLGLKGNASEASEAAKSIARANLIIKGLSVAQGDAARTADSAANTTKRMTAEFNTAARDLGTQLLPVMIRVFGAATDVLRAFNDLPGGVQVAGLAFLGLIAASGPIAGLIANLVKVISLAKATRAALIAAGLGGGAGAAGGAAAAAGAARFVPGVAAAGAVLSVGGSTGPVELDNVIRQRQFEVERERNSGLKARLEADLQNLYRLRAQRNAELESAAAGAVVGQARDAGVSGGGDASVVGGFTLPPGLRNAGGGSGGGGGRGPTGPSEADLRAMREALDLQNELDLARARGDEDAIRALEEKQTLARLTADYERAGYEDASGKAMQQLAALNEATAATELLAQLSADKVRNDEKSALARQREAEAAELLADQTLDRLGLEAELARLGGNEGAIKDAERRLFIEQRMLEIIRLKLAATKAEARVMAGAEFAELDATAEGREMAEGLVSLLRSDNIWEEAGRRFKDAAWDGLEDLLAQVFKGLNAGGQGSGIFSSIASFLGSAFGGGRASGGPMAGGSWFRVGEHGPENIVMPRDGFAIPNGALSGQGAAGVSQRAPVVRLFLDEGGLFKPRVEGIAGPIAVESSGAAYQGARQTVPADMARTQRYTRGRGR